MKKTVNQLVQELREISEAHLQINNFFWGDFGKASKRNDIDYPLMCCYYTNGSMVKNMTPIELIVIVADKIDKGNNSANSSTEIGNLTETESDTLQVCRDIANIIENSRRWKLFSRVNSITMDKFIERGDDETAGHFIKINLYLKDSVSVCNLPIEGYDFEQETESALGVDIYIDGIFVETVAPGGSYNFTT